MDFSKSPATHLLLSRVGHQETTFKPLTDLIAAAKREQYRGIFSWLPTLLLNVYLRLRSARTKSRIRRSITAFKANACKQCGKQKEHFCGMGACVDVCPGIHR